MKAFFMTACALIAIALHSARAETPKGEIKGTAFAHTTQSAKDVLLNANVALPASVTRGPAYFGPWRDMPGTAGDPVPVIVFLHGSSGLGLKAIGDWQTWLASIGIASIAPDSFALPDRVTYTSPIANTIYERIHALRSSEIPIAIAGLQGASWADKSRLILSGASEAGPAVARYEGREFAARIMFAWSCEDNYFVEGHGTRVVPDQPVLNVISSVDPYFSQANAWVGNANAKGHCAAAFNAEKRVTVVLIPQAPHTLMNIPQARVVTRAFLEDALKR